MDKRGLLLLVFLISFNFVFAGPYNNDQISCNSAGYQWATPLFNGGTQANCCGDDLSITGYYENFILNNYTNSGVGNQYLCCLRSHNYTDSFVNVGSVNGWQFTGFWLEEIESWRDLGGNFRYFYKYLDGPASDTMGYVKYSGYSTSIIHTIGSSDDVYYPIEYWRFVRSTSSRDFVILGRRDCSGCQRDIQILDPTISSSSGTELANWEVATINLPSGCNFGGLGASIAHVSVTDNDKLFVLTNLDGSTSSYRFCIFDLSDFNSVSGDLSPEYVYGSFGSVFGPIRDIYFRNTSSSSYNLYVTYDVGSNDQVNRFNINILPSYFDISGWDVSSSFSQTGGYTGLNNPFGIALDQYGFVYVADRDNHRVLILKNDLSEIVDIKQATEPGYFYTPQDIDFDNNRLYVIDTNTDSDRLFPYFTAHTCEGNVICNQNNLVDLLSEQCDGADLNGATCFNLGYTGGGSLSCNADCTFNTVSCTGAVIGCGDGNVISPEECDDSNTNSGDGCSYPLCQNECGDGFLDVIGTDGYSEECEGGIYIDGKDECVDWGYDDGTLSCGSNCQVDDSACTSDEGVPGGGSGNPPIVGPNEYLVYGDCVEDDNEDDEFGEVSWRILSSTGVELDNGNMECVLEREKVPFFGIYSIILFISVLVMFYIFREKQ